MYLNGYISLGVDRFHLNLTGSLIACDADENNLE